VYEHFGARFNLQFLAALHRQGSGATCATDNQPNRSTFATTGDPADNRANRRANSGTFDCLVRSAFRFDTAFIVGAP
jgi:hypothetical protein